LPYVFEQQFYVCNYPYTFTHLVKKDGIVLANKPVFIGFDDLTSTYNIGT